jgi:hypothetical protein
MSDEKNQSQSTAKTNPESKKIHIQEGYVPPPMATHIQTTQRLPDEAKGYTPPPMPTMLKPQASQGPSPSSSQPASAPQSPPTQPSQGQEPSGGEADSK